ncbi:MAG: glutamate--tRNA ligase [Oscillospiraceae bacterium]|jgi:glutamyl-tRNA synthetase|nr:glutamate--tRNA ligase [Oscillospiraceae bacterium]
MDYNKLAELLFPKVECSPDEIEAKFPQRDLPQGAFVTRFAPSPTGSIHFGNLFAVFTSERLAHQSGGVFYLRIEDTDQKREVEGAVEVLIDLLANYGINFDEGALIEGDNGSYGPYRQRSRKDIYHVFAKRLVAEGKAYPCFCSEEELNSIRERQEEEKANFGYYGKWAKHRDMPLAEVERAISEGKAYTVRFRSEGSADKKLRFTDLVKGDLEVTENDADYVLLKSDGIPTYHFAHVVDDHLMKTTHVVRGDEWLSTLPFHIQLFAALGWKLPKYLHISPLMIMDGDSKRKLSKRKDPEASLTFFREKGYPVAAMREYILSTLNSNFEEWRSANQDAPAEDFRFSPKKMSVSGALFDRDKLNDISKNVISRLTADEVYKLAGEWAYEFDRGFYGLMSEDPDYMKAILNIGRGGKKPRKDITVWSDLKEYAGFFFEPLFAPDYTYPEGLDRGGIAQIIREYGLMFTGEYEDQNGWFDEVKALSERLGFCPDTKRYKQEPERWKGHVGDVSMVIRVAVCGRQQSPDLYEVTRIMGEKMVKNRLKAAAEQLPYGTDSGV